MDHSFSFSIPRPYGDDIFCTGRTTLFADEGYLQLVSVSNGERGFFADDGPDDFRDIFAVIQDADGIERYCTFTQLQMKPPSAITHQTADGRQSSIKREFLSTEYVVGAHVKSEERVISSFLYASEAVRKFVGPVHFDEMDREESQTVSIRHSVADEILRHNCGSFDIVLIERGYALPDKDELILGKRAFIEVEFKNPSNLRDVKRLRRIFDSFFEIFFSGVFAPPSSVSILQANGRRADHYLLRSPPDKSNRNDLTIWRLDDSKGTLLRALAAYEQRFESISLFCNLYSLSRKASFVEGYFLTLCQAVEGLHRNTSTTLPLDPKQFRMAQKASTCAIRSVASRLGNEEIATVFEKQKARNQFSLRDRLDDLVRLMQEVFPNLAFPNLATRKISNTRNELIHGLVQETPDADFIFDFIVILECLFQFRFIQLAGFADDEIRQVTEMHRGLQRLQHPDSYMHLRRAETQQTGPD